jgi:hypothetical protein
MEHIDFETFGDDEYFKKSNDIMLIENENGLKEKLILENENGKKDLNLNNSINEGNNLGIKKKKKCCDFCLIF